MVFDEIWKLQNDSMPTAASAAAAGQGSPFHSSGLPVRLVQIFLPLCDNADKLFPKRLVDQVRKELTDTFGGVTLYLRSPAVGAWEKASGDVSRDDVILVEVMVEAIDTAWWTTYREELEQRFRQDKILIRATEVDVL